MPVRVLNKINKEKNSLTTIVIDDNEYHLTDEEIRVLLKLILDKREDLIKDFLEEHSELQCEEVEKLKKELYLTQTDLEDLKDAYRGSLTEIEDLQNELDDITNKGQDY